MFLWATQRRFCNGQEFPYLSRKPKICYCFLDSQLLNSALRRMKTVHNATACIDDENYYSIYDEVCEMGFYIYVFLFRELLYDAAYSRVLW